MLYLRGRRTRLSDQKIVKGNLDYVEIGKLKGNQGAQNYDIPAAVDLQKYNAVVIYCERLAPYSV